MNENKYKNMNEYDAIYECESEIFDLISDLMDAHGREAGKETINRVFNSFFENGYFM